MLLSERNAILLASCPASVSIIAAGNIYTAQRVQFIRPQSKEANLFSYLKKGGLKMLLKLGFRSIIRLLRFEAEAQQVAKRHKTSNDGYLMAFATRIDKQGQGYGKPLMEYLLNYLDDYGEGCYIETLKAENVDLYIHFSFQLKMHTNIQ